MITGLFKGSGRVRADALRGTWDVDGTWWCDCAKKRPYLRCFCVGCGLRRPLTTPSPEQRFWKKVNKTEGCWLWTGSRDRDGYGQFWHQKKMLAAHRWSYEMLVGPIPFGLQIDHLCRTPGCVNPNHLEPVTQRENLLRGNTIQARNAAKTHCPHGHPLAGDNLRLSRGQRLCRECIRQRRQAKTEGS